MAIERTYHCDGPDCEVHARTASAGRLPKGFLKVSDDGHANHFCTWDCVLRFAAKMEPTEYVPAGPIRGE